MQPTPQEVMTTLREGNQDSVNEARWQEEWFGCWAWSVSRSVNAALVMAGSVVLFGLPGGAENENTVAVVCLASIVLAFPITTATRWAYLKAGRYWNTHRQGV